MHDIARKCIADASHRDPTRDSHLLRRWKNLLKCCYYDTEVDF